MLTYTHTSHKNKYTPFIMNFEKMFSCLHNIELQHINRQPTINPVRIRHFRENAEVCLFVSVCSSFLILTYAVGDIQMYAIGHWQ